MFSDRSTSVPFILNPSLAVDIFHGGVKSNAVPEQAETIINHRVATHSSISELKKQYTNKLRWLAQRLDLQLFAWGEEVQEFHSPRSHSVLYDKNGSVIHLSPPRERERPFIGKVYFEQYSEGLEPAPKTPISSNLGNEDSKAWRLFSSVIRNVWRVDGDGQAIENEDENQGEGEGIIVAPSLMQGNTDTQRYWNFTRNIFRFGPGSLKYDKTGLGALTG